MTIKEFGDAEGSAMEVYMGPGHPMLHGLWAYRIVVDGERILDSEVMLGYVHRGLEKLAENRTYVQYGPIADRLCYGCSTFWNVLYVMGIEKCMGITNDIPERAQYLRVIGMELTRIASHLLWLAAWLADLGSWTMLMLPYREREYILDIMEQWTGQRLNYNFSRVGGMWPQKDLPEGWIDRTHEVLDHILHKLEQYRRYCDESDVFLKRSKHVGVMSKELALSLGVTGPNLRASGVPLDWRTKTPYLVYDRMKFEVPCQQEGDNYARYRQRMLEIRESANIVRQAMYDLPEGEIWTKPPRKFDGRAFFRLEDPRGESAVFIVGQDSNTPYRVKFRSPNFVNMQCYAPLLKGKLIANTVSVIGSMDVCMGETDR